MFDGVMTAMVTPFKNGEVDCESLRRFVEFQIENAVDALLVLGTTGEAPTISDGERERIIGTVLEVNDGKLPIIVGAGTNSTEKSLKLIKSAEKQGVDGVLVVTPYYNKPTQDGLYQHFKYLSERTSLKIIVYNVPGRTGVNILPETVLRIAQDLRNVVGIKEASGNIAQIDKLMIELRKTREDFKVWSGNDDQAFHVMNSGGNGVISVLSNIAPKQVADMCRYALDGNVIEARKIHQRFFKLMKALFVETNPIPVKSALSLMGLVRNELRLPLTPAKETTTKLLETLMRECGLI